MWDGLSGFRRPKLVSGRFLQPRAAKLSLPLFSPLSLSFPHLFPCPFLTPSLTPSLCKPQNSGGFRVRLQSFGFTPAALAQLVPVPAITPGQEPSPVATGTQRVSLQARGVGISPPDSPEMIKILKKPALVVQPRPQLPARPSQDKATVLTLLFPSQKDPNPSPNTLWALRAWGFVALFGFGVLFFHGWDFPTAWHIGNAPLGEASGKSRGESLCVGPRAVGKS